MSNDFVAKTCEPCRGGIPPLTKAEAEGYLQQVSGWALVDDGRRIERSFTFKNFKEAMDFVASVGNLAEMQGHHPDISFGWGWAKVSWQTKKIKGLHENDFIMAAKTDQLFGA
jgi:4a-hydroxytetrahydrobiopterin dehydratase